MRSEISEKGESLYLISFKQSRAIPAIIFQGFQQSNIAFGCLSPPHEEPCVGGLEIFDGQQYRSGGMAAKSHMHRRQGIRPRRRGLIRETDTQQSDSILPQVTVFYSLIFNNHKSIWPLLLQGSSKRARQHSPTVARCLSRCPRNHERWHRDRSLHHGNRATPVSSLSCNVASFLNLRMESTFESAKRKWLEAPDALDTKAILNWRNFFHPCQLLWW